jgi:hypothetical protein
MRVKPIRSQSRKLIQYFILFVAVLIIVYISGKYRDFSLFFSFQVYDLRLEARMWNMPVVLSYLWTMTKTILPVYFIYFLSNKNRKLCVFIAFIIFINFSINGTKATLFYLFIALIGYKFFKREKNIQMYLWGLVGVSLIGFMEWGLLNTQFIDNFVIRRVEFVPAMLNYQYYDFFSTHEFDFMRTSFLRHLGVDSPYANEGVANTIGTFMGSSEMKANNGLFSDAYFNFGVIGILTFPFFLVLWLRIMDAHAVAVDKKLLFMPVVATVIPIISTSLFTCLLTHGLIVLLICLMSIAKTKQD